MKMREFAGWVMGAALLAGILGYAVARVSIILYRLINLN